MRIRVAALRVIQGICVALTIAAFQSCSSAKKQRLEEREKLSATTGFYCQFINGDQYQDFEVVLNLEMAKRCDPTKPFSISDFKSAADIHGLLYCCSMAKKEKAGNANRSQGRPATAKAEEPPAKKDPAAKAAGDAKPEKAAASNSGGDKAGSAEKASSANEKPPQQPNDDPVMEQPKSNSAGPEDAELDQ